MLLKVCKSFVQKKLSRQIYSKLTKVQLVYKSFTKTKFLFKIHDDFFLSKQSLPRKLLDVCKKFFFVLLKI
jgi:hypothetical protein